jgi:hypothetical protein
MNSILLFECTCQRSLKLKHEFYLIIWSICQRSLKLKHEFYLIIWMYVSAMLKTKTWILSYNLIYMSAKLKTKTLIRSCKCLKHLIHFVPVFTCENVLYSFTGAQIHTTHNKKLRRGSYRRDISVSKCLWKGHGAVHQAACEQGTIRYLLVVCKGLEWCFQLLTSCLWTRHYQVSIGSM